MSFSPRQRTDEHQGGLKTFRSPRVLKHVIEIEKKQQTMTPDEAIAKLRRAVFNVVHDSNRTKWTAGGAQEVLDGLETACWKTFPREKDDKSDMLGADGSGQHGKPGTKILYSQLLHGTEKMLEKEKTMCNELRSQLQHVEARKKELVRKMQACQAVLARAKSHDRPSAEVVDVHSDVNGDDAAAVTEELSKTRRRRDLRTWACNDLRAGLNDLVRRRKELKRVFVAVTDEVKEEEEANKVRKKQLRDVESSSHAPTVCENATQQQLTVALAKKHTLEHVHKDQKAYTRARTEGIFDVRRDLRELNNQRITVQKHLDDLRDETASIKRALTPRPDWVELHDATVITTAVDRARMRIETSPDKVSEASEVDGNDDYVREHCVTHILSNNWSTVAKVGAMATELANIRIRDQTGDTILAEQEKLEQFRQEIARLMHQLEAIKAQSAA